MGAYDTTSTIEYTESNLPNNIKIYPNPTSDFFYIDQKDLSDIKYSLHDLNGRVVKSFDAEVVNQILIIPTIDLAKGSYVLKARSSNGDVTSWSIIVH